MTAFTKNGHTSNSSGNYLVCHYVTRLLSLSICVIMGILIAGCTTLQPIADNAVSLHTDLRSGEAVKPGDKVRVVTRDGLSRLLIVTALDKNTLKGNPEGVETPGAVITLPIDEIVFMEGRKVSVGKTAAYTSGFTLGAVLAAGIAFIIVIATW